MRRSKGKLALILGGVAVLVVVAALVAFSKDIYCYLFLDPRLVGRWEGSELGLLDFDKCGNVRATSPEQSGTYRIDGTSLIISWPNEQNPNELTYRIAGDRLSVDRDGRRATLRRTSR